jgi:hypothetical protein
MFGGNWKDWMVVFDTQYSRVLEGQIDPAWHYDRHYFLAMSLDDGGRAVGETRAQAVTRVARSVRPSAINTDWAESQDVYSVQRGLQPYRPGAGAIREPLSPVREDWKDVSGVPMQIYNRATDRCWTVATPPHFIVTGTVPGAGYLTLKPCITPPPPEQTFRHEALTSQIETTWNGNPVCLQIENNVLSARYDARPTGDPLGVPDAWMSGFPLDARPCSSPDHLRLPSQRFGLTTGSHWLGVAGKCLGVYRDDGLLQVQAFHSCHTGEQFFDVKHPGVSFFDGGYGDTWEMRLAASPLQVFVALPEDLMLRSWFFVGAGVANQVGATTVQFLLDGTTVLGTDEGPHFEVKFDTSTLPDGEHVITAVAADAAGRVVTSAPVRVRIDNAPPTVSVSAPADNTLARGAVTLGATASDSLSGLQRVEFLVDGQVAGAAANLAAPSLTLDSATLADGERQVTARAADVAGNVGSSAAIRLRVDNTPPTVQLTSPAAGTLARATDVLAVRATASDAYSGVAGVRFLLDGTTVLGTATSAPYETTLRLAGLPDGEHLLSAVGTDVAGNEATATPVRLRIDNTPPTVRLTEPDPGRSGVTVYHTSPITLRAEASDSGSGVAKVRFLVDGATVLATDTAAPYEVTVDAAAISNGVHAITALALDAAGNQAVSEAAQVNASPARAAAPAEAVATATATRAAPAEGTLASPSPTPARSAAAAGPTEPPQSTATTTPTP